jgi:hypothetical protein
MGQLCRLERFYASFNSFTGAVNGRFCQGQDSPLATLVLRANQLTGQVDMRNCPAMEILDFQVIAAARADCVELHLLAWCPSGLVTAAQAMGSSDEVIF